jgi:superfamily II DNA helicase RecQ
MKIVISTQNTTFNSSICLKLSGFSTELSNIPENTIITVHENNNHNISISVLPIVKDVEIPHRKHSISKNVPTIQPESEDSALYEELSSLRRQISLDEGIPAYIVMHDKTLLEMCRVLPLDFDSLMTISGIGSRKIAKYGSKFIEIIKAHVE